LYGRSEILRPFRRQAVEQLIFWKWLYVQS
jgi:hypothetical protein